MLSQNRFPPEWSLDNTQQKKWKMSGENAVWKNRPKKKNNEISIKVPIQEPGVPVQVIPRCFNSFFVSVEWIFIIGQLLFRFISVYVINTANRF